MKNMNKNNIESIMDFKTDLERHLKDPKFRKLYDEHGRQLEIAYKLLQLRKQKGISQSEIAKKIGTTQGNIARIEAGNQNCTIQMLDRLAKAYDRELKIEFVK